MWRALLLIWVLLAVGCTTTEGGRAARPSPIRATGVGNTMEEAKESAFRQAIENRIGVLVLGEREVQSYRLLKDEILTYSAGYIDDYTLISQERASKKWIVTADVWVSSSKLTSRIISSSSSDGKMNGKKASDSFSSFVKQKQQADRLSAKILAGFPENALVAKFNRTELKFDGHRNANVLIYFETSWNRGYLDALNELLTLIQDGGDAQSYSGVVRVLYKSEGDWFPSQERYRFSDTQLFQKFETQFDDRRIAVRLKMRDGQRVVHEDCWNLPDAYVSKGYDRSVQILGHRKYESVITLTIPYNSKAQQILASANSIVLAVESADKCSKNGNRSF